MAASAVNLPSAPGPGGDRWAPVRTLVSPPLVWSILNPTAAAPKALAVGDPASYVLPDAEQFRALDARVAAARAVGAAQRDEIAWGAGPQADRRQLLDHRIAGVTEPGGTLRGDLQGRGVARTVDAAATSERTRAPGSFGQSGLELDSDRFIVPGEWERQESLWMSSPTYENVQDRPSEVVYRDLIRETYGHVKVDMIVNDASERAKLKTDWRANNIPFDHVEFHTVEHGDVWIRDMGPFFVRSADKRAVKIVDFDFNYWGYAGVSEEAAEASVTEERVDRLIAADIGVPTIKSTMTIEGGTMEFNGKGTMLVPEHVVMQRNPQYNGDKALAEAEFKRVLGVEKVIWLGEGLIADEHTINGPLAPAPHPYTAVTPGGHTDEFVKFVNPTTILLAEVTKEEAARDPFAAIDRERMERNYQILKHATDQDGNPFTIIRMHVPDTIMHTLVPGDSVYDFMATINYLDGSGFPQGQPIQVIEPNSYFNYMITNGKVIGQKFWKPGRPESIHEKDLRAKEILEKAFPGREVVLIDAENVNLGGGGVHCIMQQQPATRD